MPVKGKVARNENGVRDETCRRRERDMECAGVWERL
jgi:hypothetical protein